MLTHAELVDAARAHRITAAAVDRALTSLMRQDALRDFMSAPPKTLVYFHSRIVERLRQLGYCYSTGDDLAIGQGVIDAAKQASWQVCIERSPLSSRIIYTLTLASQHSVAPSQAQVAEIFAGASSVSSS